MTPRFSFDRQRSMSCVKRATGTTRNRPDSAPNLDLRRIMLRKLVAVDAAEALDDLRVPPGNRLEKLKRDRAGQHSVRINDQWRICFRWTGTDAADVEIVNYH
jgi:proteic killer suppression protein